MAGKTSTFGHSVKVALKASATLAALVFAAVTPAFARDLQYGGDEAVVYVKPGEPTQVTFPSKIEGGYKKDKNSDLVLERQGSFLIVFARQQLGIEGESIIVHLDDKRTYALRMVPATDGDRDVEVKINDTREVSLDPEDAAFQQATPLPETGEFPTAATVPGLMREMMLTAEFGKQKGIPGYRRSNKFSGQTVLDDGNMVAQIDEIFMGTDFWGYVLSVENRLDISQRINPATFRLDGTRAVSAQRWELSATPQTEEQKLASAHKAKVYIITRAKRN